MNKDENGFEIDLLQLLRALWDKAIYIFLVTAILGVIGFVGSKTLLTPIYEASAKIIINTRKDESQNITNDQINSAKNLVNTYAIIIRSRDVLNRVKAELNLTESYNELANSISINAVNNTQIMRVTVLNKNADTAFAIAEKILEITPSVIAEKYEAGSVKPVEQAYVDPDPVSPNIFRNTAIMAMLGILLSCGVVVIVSLADNTYKSDWDIQKDLEIPVLGVIPTIESCNGCSWQDHPRKVRK